MSNKRPHILGIDDAPFVKGQVEDVPIVGVMMEGATLVEGVALGAFPVDGAGATEYLAEWVAGLRWYAALKAVVLGGITIAGLGLVDLAALAESLGLPVLAATRHDTSTSELAHALRAAGLTDRLAILDRTPPAHRLEDGLYVTIAGTDAPTASSAPRSTKRSFPNRCASPT